MLQVIPSQMNNLSTVTCFEVFLFDPKFFKNISTSQRVEQVE